VLSSALVLGAGGITGIAWQLGLLTGLRAAGVDLTTADLIVGTSAGSVTGALAAEVISEERYLGALSRRLPFVDWPERPLLITAVDAHTGEPFAWDRSAGVALVRAVAASCAVPGIFPPVTVNGSRFMDGGVRSGTNADLAADAERVVVLAPLAPVRPRGAPTAELDARRERSAVVLAVPDETVLDVLGPDVFDTTRWEPVLDAAIAQGRRIAPDVAPVWPT
jgi:NTE family protein